MINVSFNKIKMRNIREKQDKKYIEVPNHNNLLIVFFYNRKTANYPFDLYVVVWEKTNHSDILLPL